MSHLHAHYCGIAQIWLSEMLARGTNVSDSNSFEIYLLQCIICPYRSDTSYRQRRWLPPCPLIIALVPFKCFSRNFQFPHNVPFTKEKMPRCLFPSKAYRPATFALSLNNLYNKHQTMSIFPDADILSVTSQCNVTQPSPLCSRESWAYNAKSHIHQTCQTYGLEWMW